MSPIYAPGTNDDTHCENCNGGCPGLCQFWARRDPRRPCKTKLDQGNRQAIEAMAHYAAHKEAHPDG